MAFVVPARFNGPPGSGNGGYSCGLVAAQLDTPAAEVTLRAPPPLERPLEVQPDGDGVRVLDGETLVAEGRPAELSLQPPGPAALEEAEDAARAGYDKWSRSHPFPTCVVCGPDRDAGDGFRMFPGRLPGAETAFACVWTPESDSPEQVWAALDCPTSAPVANFGTGPALVLGRLTARIDALPEPGRAHVVMSWPLGADGRKRHAAAALYGPGGDVLAVSRALWIELRG